LRIGVPACQVVGMGRRAGKYLAVVALALTGLAVTGTSGKLGVNRPHMSPDRHVCGGIRGDQTEVCL